MPKARAPEPAVRIAATPYVWRDPRSIPRRQWLYGRHYIRRFTTATVAPGGLGKSSLALVEALAMVTGRPLLGFQVPKPLRVWIWNGEDPREEIERRLAAALIHFDISPEDIGDRLFIDSGRETPIILAEKLGEGITVVVPIVDALTAEIRARQIDVMIVDPFVSCHAVPENDNGAIDRVTKTWARIAEATNCGVELVHHVRKAGSGQTTYTVEDARGGSALIGAVRSARVLNAMSPEEAETADIAASDRRRFFRVDDGKSNMAPPVERAEWRELVSVGLGNDDVDGPEDLVGVATAWMMPGLFADIDMDDTRRVQKAIAAGSWSESVQAGNWAGRAIGEVLGIDTSPKTPGQTRVKALLKGWLKGGALKVTHEHDSRNGRSRPMIVVGQWV
ncbi:hypothetical protein ADL19_32855 [Streptomyces purpurogeneiscleroticus]|nr:hypothetical protein ADL19_32855 [Streptomyces purpurogeneiscleroticus]